MIPSEKTIAEIIKDYVSPENDIITENQEREKAAKEILQLFIKSQSEIILACEKYLEIFGESDMKPEDECYDLYTQMIQAIGNTKLILFDDNGK